MAKTRRFRRRRPGSKGTKVSKIPSTKKKAKLA